MTIAMDAGSRVDVARSPDARPHDWTSETACRPQRVLIVDEREVVQAGLRALLDGESWVASCLTAGSAEVAVEVARRTQPQLILLSMSVRGRSGLQLCRELRARLPLARIVLMSAEGRVSPSLGQVHGAVGFIPQGLPASTIIATVKRAAEGEKVFAKASDGERRAALSQRELEVLQHLVSGLSNPEVAAELHLSHHTVKQHTSMVYKKLGVRNRAQAASRAQELGLVG